MFYILLVGASILATVWGSFVGSVLWGWYIVPTFNLPEVTIVQFFGLALTFAILGNAEEAQNEEQMIQALIRGFIRPLIFLGVGFVGALFL